MESAAATSLAAAIDGSMGAHDPGHDRDEDAMSIRIAAIEVSHWHALNDAAYLRHLVAMKDVELVAIQDGDAGLVAKRAAEVGGPPTFTDYRKMLSTTRPDFVVALGRHRQMAAIASDLLDAGYPFLMEKPMGISASEVEQVAAKAARLGAFVAVPLAQRYGEFAKRARELLAAGRFGPLSHIYVRINRPGPARYQAWDCAWMLDPAEAGGGCLRNLGSHGLDMFLHLTGEGAQVTGAQVSCRAHGLAVEDYASVMLRSASGVLGTVEVGNGFPRDGTDGEWKIAGHDAILVMRDGKLTLTTAEGEQSLPGSDVTAPYFAALRDAIDHWRRGAPPPIGVHDCARAVRLIDDAYARAGELPHRDAPLPTGKPRPAE
jgi:predicted dehydrogenase